MVSINDMLKASKGLPVDDIFAELWGRKLASDYTIATYTGTLPATLTGTKAGYLHSYKIYGNTEQTGTPTPENPIVPQECGERTGNLFNSGWEQGYISVTTGENQPSNNVVRTAGYIPVEYNKIYSMSRNLSGGVMSLRFYDAQKSYITGGEGSSDVMQLISGQTYLNPMTTNLGFCCFKITDNRVAYIRVHDYANSLNTQYMMVEGEYTERTMPEYEPYGYKLPLTSAGQSVDIYLGDDTLSTEEYVDSGTGKIYRMVGGVLTPVDPPVPFPQIPTSAGSTTISWAGEGLAPSQVELTYERK